MAVWTLTSNTPSSYLQRVEASLQVRPVLVFLSGGGVEFTPPVHELLLLSATCLKGQVNKEPEVLNTNGATQ